MNSHQVSVLIEALGWSLIHFFWQGMIIGSLLWLMLFLSKKCSASFRYVLSGLAMLLMALVAAGTILWQFTLVEWKQPAPISTSHHLPNLTPVPQGFDSAERTRVQPLPVQEIAPSLQEDSSPENATHHFQWREISASLRPALPWFVGLWALGVAVLSLRLFNSWRLVRKWRLGGIGSISEEWIMQFQKLVERMKITQQIKLLSSTIVAVPMVIGWLKPLILLPAGLITNLTPSQLEAVLAHELAHVRRQDYLVNLLQNILETLFFYHPAVWWVSAQLRKEREHCCDDIASTICGDPLEYAKALTALEELRVMPSALVMSATGGSLLNRVRRLLGAADEKRAGVGWPLVVLLLAVIALTGPVAWLRANDSAPPREESKMAAKPLSPSPEQARAQENWEKFLPLIPDKEYYSGSPISKADPAIFWTEPNEAGLRMGISGISLDGIYPVGKRLPWISHLRNDGQKMLKLSPCGFTNEGIVASLTDENKIKHGLTRQYPTAIVMIRCKLQPGEFIKLQSTPTQLVLAKADGTPSRSSMPATTTICVKPGRYQFEMENHIGERNDKAIQGDKIEPSILPGADDWRGTLLMKPMEITVSEPEIKTARPGDIVELSDRHRLQFEKEVINLSHYAGWPGLTGTINGSRWDPTRREWKITDPSGEYLAAWDVGGTRLWYVDDTGIQYLEIEDTLVSKGHWSMPEATGSLAEMPEGVRRALKLPAKVSANANPPGSQKISQSPPAPIIRGFSLEGVPCTLDSASIDRIYKRSAYLFEMPIYDSKDTPWLKFPTGAEKREYYIELNGLTYGPIAGSGVEDLKLMELLREKLASEDRADALLRLRKMVFSKDTLLKEQARALMLELKQPAWRYDYDELIEVLERVNSAEDKEALQHVRAMSDAAKVEWEKNRVTLSEESYSQGEKLELEKLRAKWMKRTALGIRLGIAGVEAGSKYSLGDAISFDVLLRNDGSGPIKFSWTPRLDEGLRVWLTDENGTRWNARIVMNTIPLRANRTRLDPGQFMKLKESDVAQLTLVRGDDNGAPVDPNEGNGPASLAVKPGKYKLQIEARIGSFEMNDGDGKITVPAAGEWTGTLTSDPVEIEINDIKKAGTAPSRQAIIDVATDGSISISKAKDDNKGDERISTSLEELPGKLKEFGLGSGSGITIRGSRLANTSSIGAVMKALGNADISNISFATAVPLEFRLVSDTPTASTESFPAPMNVSTKDGNIHIEKSAVLTTSEVASAKALPVPILPDTWSLHLELTKAGGEAMAQISRDNLGKRMAIVLHGAVIQAPNIQGEFGSKFEITGHYTQQDAESLATSLQDAIENASADKNESVVEPRKPAEDSTDKPQGNGAPTETPAREKIESTPSKRIDPVVNHQVREAENLMSLLSGLPDEPLTRPSVAGIQVKKPTLLEMATPRPSEPQRGLRLRVTNSEGTPIPAFRVLMGKTEHLTTQFANSPITEFDTYTEKGQRFGLNGNCFWPYDDMPLDTILCIEAEGFESQTVDWNGADDVTQEISTKLTPKIEIRGRLLAPDGKPAAGAEISKPGSPHVFQIIRGEIMGAVTSGLNRIAFQAVKSDSNGKFLLHPGRHEKGEVFVSHQTGFLEIDLRDLAKADAIKLKPWSRVSGKLLGPATAISKQTIMLKRNTHSSEDSAGIYQEEMAMTGEDGSFVFEKIIPGRCEISVPGWESRAARDQASEYRKLKAKSFVDLKPGDNEFEVGGMKGAEK